MAVARSLSTPYQLGLTEALRRGEGRVEQCSWCGLLAATSRSGTAKLGPCPDCGCATWWRQEVPVGPFRGVTARVDAENDLEIVWEWLRYHAPHLTEAGKARALADLARRLGGSAECLR